MAALPVWAQQAPQAGVPGVQAMRSDKFKIQYIRIGNDAEAMLFEPATAGPKSRIALVLSHPNRDTFDQPFGPELAERGYRVLTVNYRGDRDSGEGLPEHYLPGISRGIAYMRALPGVQRAIVGGHSGGVHLGTLYDNVAEHGPAACKGPEKIFPCDERGLAGLEKADGLVLLDGTIGSGHQMSAVDPAVKGDGRDPSLDMFRSENGYDLKAKSARYAPEFAKRFYAAQAARNNTIVGAAVERMKLIAQGKGQFSNDEPFVIPGMGVRASGARLYQADVSINSRTKKPHLLLRPDGTDAEVVLETVRPPIGQNVLDQLNALNVMNSYTTVRAFLSGSAIRATADYAFTTDDIVGVDWTSSYNSSPGNAEGITVPTLVLAMTCHYLVVPDEIIFDRLASKDKTYAAVEGATHDFKPCKPEYGDTMKRTFDFIDQWLAKEGRF